MTDCPKMTDAELAGYLHLTPAEAAIVIPKLTAELRAVYDRMRQVEIEADLWMNGLGPKPVNVLLDTERSMGRRKISRAFVALGEVDAPDGFGGCSQPAAPGDTGGSW